MGAGGKAAQLPVDARGGGAAGGIEQHPIVLCSPQHAVNLGRPLGATVPDFFYEPRNDSYEGLCVYLDGMSGHLHGRPETRDKDRQVREELRNRGFEVVEIPFGQLTDPNAMRQHFFRIGRFLLGKEAAQRIRDASSWYESSG